MCKFPKEKIEKNVDEKKKEEKIKERERVQRSVPTEIHNNKSDTILEKI